MRENDALVQPSAWQEPTAPLLPFGGDETNLDSPAATDGASLESHVAALEATLKKAAEKEDAAKAAAGGKPTFNLTGVINFDTAFFGGNTDSLKQFPPGKAVEDAVGFRRLRLGAYGDAFDVCFYRLEIDFAPFVTVPNATDTGTQMMDGPAVKSAYVGLRDVPILGDVQIGHIKEPYSLEHVNRDRYGTFMERSVSDQGNLVPLRSPGIKASNYSQNERMTWQYGVFVPEVPETPPTFLGTQAGVAFTGRMTCLPWYDEESGGSRYLHLGAAYSFRANATGNLVYAAHPECNFAPNVITTSGFLDGANGDVMDNQLLGSEFSLVYGPWCLQGEYYRSFVARRDHPNVEFPGYYTYLTYFLTGEYKPYNRKRGDFDRVEPNSNLNYSRKGDQPTTKGWGAWQVGYRYSSLDLDDGLVQGGQLGAHTIGLNWYLNPYTRFEFNYVVADVRRTLNGVGEGIMQVFETRAAIDF